MCFGSFLRISTSIQGLHRRYRLQREVSCKVAYLSVQKSWNCDIFVRNAAFFKTITWLTNVLDFAKVGDVPKDGYPALGSFCSPSGRFTWISSALSWLFFGTIRVSSRLAKRAAARFETDYSPCRPFRSPQAAVVIG